jgi:TolA-binding protein
MFLDEMLHQASVWNALPERLGVRARQTYLEDRSIRSYREGILRFPDSPFVPRAHSRIAAIYARRGEWRAAMREYDMLLDRFPQDEQADEARLERARLFFAAGEYASARDEAFLLIDSYLESPLQADAYLLAAKAQQLLGELEEAELAYLYVEHLTTHGSPQDIGAREGLAEVAVALGDVEEAARLYEGLLAEATTQPERDAREFELARLYLDAGETARARQMLRRTLYGYELNAYRPAAAFLLADSYYGEGRLPQALEYYVGALVDFPTFEQRIPALFRAADAYKRLALYDEALEMLRGIPAAHDPSPTEHEKARAMLLEGEVLLLSGRYGAALEALYSALAGEVTTAEAALASYWIAESYYRGGYYNEALEAYDAALARAPEHPLALEAMTALAACYEKKGWLDDARAYYARIVESATADDTPAQLDIRSRAALRLLNSYSARELYQEELDWARTLLEGEYTFIDEAQLLYRMGRAYERLNNLDSAAARYAEVLSRFPGTEWARQATVKVRHIDMLKQIKDASH